MEIRHLRYFVAVAEELNFTRAAAKLRLAQPSLTRQIKDLEEELGVLLFDRSKNRISLTEGGRVFLSEARRLMAHCEACVQTMQRLGRSESGVLNIGYIARTFSDLLPKTLRAFRQERPQAELHLFEMNAAEQYRALEEQEIDLGFVDLRPPSNSTELNCACVGKYSILAAMNNRDPLAKNVRIPLRSLEPMFFVERSEKSYPGARARLIETCRGAGFTPRILHEAEGYSAIISFVAEDLGVALLPEQKRTLPNRDGVVFRPLQPHVTSDSYAIWRSDNLSSLLKRYLEIVKELSPDRP
jgi:DNA-binding transcriptional LysR family regulator